MKKALGLMIVFFSLCIAVPSQAQSQTAVDLLKVKSKEAREKLKDISKAKLAEKKNAEKKSKEKANMSISEKKSSQTKFPVSEKSDSKVQPAAPAPAYTADEKKIKPRLRYVPVDTSQYHPW